MAIDPHLSSSSCSSAAATTTTTAATTTTTAAANPVHRAPSRPTIPTTATTTVSHQTNPQLSRLQPELFSVNICPLPPRKYAPPSSSSSAAAAAAASASTPAQGIPYPVASSGRGFVSLPKSSADQGVTVANPRGCGGGGGSGYPPRPVQNYVVRPIQPQQQLHHYQYLHHHPQQQPHFVASVKGVPVSLQPKVAPSPSVPECNGYKDMRDKSRDDSLTLVRDRRPQYGDTVRYLPKPLPIPMETSTLQKKEGEEEEDDGDERELGFMDEESVKHLSAEDLFKRHVNCAINVRARLREVQLKRIARYKGGFVQSSAMASFIPRDIMVDILCLLPVEDLVRYRPVCKLWCSLIDGPDFIKMHLHHRNSIGKTSCVFVTGDGDLFWVDDLHTLKPAVKLTNPLGHCVETQVLGSSNGLLALKNSENDIVLWNPSTRRFRKLPDIPFPGEDSIYNVFIFGFGHDPVNNDYKLVRVWKNNYEDCEINVYSAKSNTWTGHEFCNYCDLIPSLCSETGINGVVLNNNLHWLVSSRGHRGASKSCLTIMSFDLVTEEIHEVGLPDFAEISCRNIELDVIGGCLCVILSYRLQHVDVWVMKEYRFDKSWTKLSLPSSRYRGYYPSIVAPLKKNGCDGVMLKYGKALIWYDMERKLIGKMWVANDGIYWRLKSHMCVESLVGLDSELGWKQVEEDAKEKNQIIRKDDQIMDEGLSFMEVSISNDFLDREI